MSITFLILIIVGGVLIYKVTNRIVSIISIAYVMLVLNLIGLNFYYLYNNEDRSFVVYLISLIVFLCITIIANLLLKRGLLVSHKDNKPAELVLIKNPIALSLISLIFLILGSFYFLNGIPLLSKNPDFARFYNQNIPLFGFVFRIIYWILPLFSILLLQILRQRPKHLGMKVYTIFFVFMNSAFLFLSGSKGAILQYIVLLTLYFAYTRKLLVRLKIKNILQLILIFTITFLLVGWLTMRYSGVDSVSKGLDILFWRLTTGSAEGFDKIVTSYTVENGFGYGWYTFVKPFITLMGTFRIIPKSNLTLDTGGLLGIYYRGAGNLAPYTYTILGQGYLEFGFLGSILYAGIYGLLLSLINYSIETSISKLLRNSFLITIGWSLITLGNWGYIDGWLVYSMIYIIFGYLVAVLSTNHYFRPINSFEKANENI